MSTTIKYEGDRQRVIAAMVMCRDLPLLWSDRAIDHYGVIDRKLLIANLEYYGCELKESKVQLNDNCKRYKVVKKNEQNDSKGKAPKQPNKEGT